MAAICIYDGMGYVVGYCMSYPYYRVINAANKHVTVFPLSDAVHYVSYVDHCVSDADCCVSDDIYCVSNDV